MRKYCLIRLGLIQVGPRKEPEVSRISLRQSRDYALSLLHAGFWARISCEGEGWNHTCLIKRIGKTIEFASRAAVAKDAPFCEEEMILLEYEFCAHFIVTEGAVAMPLGVDFGGCSATFSDTRMNTVHALIMTEGVGAIPFGSKYLKLL